MEILSVALKILVIVSGLVGIYRGVISGLFDRRSKLREDYKFLKRLLSDIDQANGKPHPMLLELGYEAIAGWYLAPEEILYLMKFPQPLAGIRDYAAGKRLLSFSSVQGPRIEWKVAVSKGWRRRIAKGLYFGLYFLSGFLALVPLATWPIFFGRSNLYLLETLAVGTVCGLLAYLFLSQSSAYFAADRLLKQQSRCSAP